MNEHWKNQTRVPAGVSEGGQFASEGGITATHKSKDELKVLYDNVGETDINISARNQQKYRKFNTHKDVEDFFKYDDGRKGLLAKKNSLHGK